jgi:phosphatidate cytidylyltransferase
MAVAALAAIILLPSPALRVLVVVLSLGALWELLGIVRTGAGAQPRSVATALVAAAFTAAVCWTWSGGAPVSDLLLLAALAVVLIEVLWAGRAFGDAAATVAAGVYIGLPLGALAAVHALGGREVVLLLLGTVVVSDSSQYYTGRLLGRHLLAPTISPKKTIEGAVGGVLFGTTAMVLGGRLVLPDVGLGALAAVGLAVVLLGICGDLFESRLKRTAGVKDSSNLIPGHGGVLDRIDALLFATPAFYLAVRTWL